MSRGWVFTVLPGQMSKQDSSGHCNPGPERVACNWSEIPAPSFTNTPDWPITACTMHSGYPVRPPVCLWNCRNKCQRIWVTRTRLGHAASAGTFQSVMLCGPGGVRALTCLFSGPERGVWLGGGAEQVAEERGTGWDTEYCCPTLLSWNKEFNLKLSWRPLMHDYHIEPFCAHLSNTGLWASAGFSLWGSVGGRSRCCGYIKVSCLGLSFFMSSR